MNKQELIDWLSKTPPKEDVGMNGDGSLYLLIDPLEATLDEGTDYTWSTRNFQFRITSDVNAEQMVWASLELVVGDRSFVGAVNFRITAYNDNTDYLATAKTLCEKNAASDWGRRTGRYLNLDSGHPDHQSERSYFKPNGKQKESVKVKPDKQTREKYAKAAIENDHETIHTLETIYDFTIQ